MSTKDKELADKIVALGVGGYVSDGTYRLSLTTLESLLEDEFVRDWRVAGALMEKCEAQCVEWEDLEPGHWQNMNHTANTPRAIIEACMEALS